LYELKKLTIGICINIISSRCDAIIENGLIIIWILQLECACLRDDIVRTLNNFFLEDFELNIEAIDVGVA
jgi:hypothetical protein